MANPNIVGDNGERLAAIRLTQGNIFDVIVIGGKAPAFDLLCQIEDPVIPYQFLVQVKATEADDVFTKKKPIRIKTPVPAENYRLLQIKPLPTYVAGVDITTEDVFIAPAYQTINLYGGSIPTLYHLTKADLQQSLKYLTMLKDDVVAYWDRLDIQNYKSAFKSRLV